MSRQKFRMSKSVSYKMGEAKLIDIDRSIHDKEKEIGSLIFKYSAREHQQGQISGRQA
jgi:hypothetical protein